MKSLARWFAVFGTVSLVVGCAASHGDPGERTADSLASSVPLSSLPDGQYIVLLDTAGGAVGTITLTKAGDQLTLLPGGALEWDHEDRAGVQVAPNGHFEGSTPWDPDSSFCRNTLTVKGDLRVDDDPSSDPVLSVVVEHSDSGCTFVTTRSFSGSTPFVDLSGPGVLQAESKQGVAGTVVRYAKLASGERLVFFPYYFGSRPLRASELYPDTFGERSIYGCRESLYAGASGGHMEGCTGSFDSISVPEWFTR
jgi:hypothetical protein